MLRGERIIGDFRMSLREPPQQRRLAGVGQADQAGVGDHLQFQDDPAFLAGHAGRSFTGRAVGRGGKGAIAASAASALRHGDLLARFGQVAQDMAAVAVENQGAGRDVEEEVVGAWAVAVGRPAGAAALGAPMLLVHNRGQAVGAGHGADDDAAAVAAVAAVRPAARHVLLAPEAADAAAAVAPLYIDHNAINKHYPIISGAWGGIPILPSGSAGLESYPTRLITIGFAFGGALG